ncbi:type I pullulanase [Clostridium estertheticum]|uniref:type I pullulanase n=1 Tax=Clostridium estertheticum TaxID=238834 RepID=UPI0013EE7C99|nr:type I pullulanase [Clostridium estertheticum]MBZ9609182.1 type I pullulanase [Clostridium estertheticum]
MKLKRVFKSNKVLIVLLTLVLVITNTFFLFPNAKTFARGTIRVFSAVKLDDMKNINIETSLLFPFTNKDNKGITVKADGKELVIKAVTSTTVKDGLTKTAQIELLEDAILSQKLTISKEGFKDKDVTLGKVMGCAGFDKLFNYSGNDLGNTYTKAKTSFRVWAPTATETKLIVYKKWDDKTGTEINMNKGGKGTWIAELKGDQKNIFYTYKVNVGGKWNEAVDPYARSVAANGDKGAVIDLKDTDPDKWEPNTKPKFTKLNDAIIYETHVRDFSIDTSSGIKNKGKFLGLTETGTKTPDGSKTGIDYIKNLGVTHVQLMPIFDYASVDETSSAPQYNWGYDPKNYNTPEGSYSTDPYNPNVRVKELKEAVQALHDKRLRVTMDVVYNHMYSAEDSNFNKIVPGYYFRYNNDGTLANESGCGNAIASENSMARKFIVDSVVYWTKEYNLDGFRFDLMGLTDTRTMNEVRAALNSIDPSIVVIGEGWDMGATLKPEDKSDQKNADKLANISFFNDTIRDGIKGSVFDATGAGFVNGKTGAELDIKKGIVGATYFSTAINTWGKVNPLQSVNYVEAHDNNTLWDKLLLTNPNDTDATRLKMDRLANSIIFTSQGIPFFQAGQEFLRTKGGNSNSYNADDSVNLLDWNRMSDNKDTVNYVKGLIELKKAHPAFSMDSANMITKKLKFIDTAANVVAYSITDNENKDKWSSIIVAFNANKTKTTIKLPKNAKWNIVVDGEKAGVKTLRKFKGDSVVVPAQTSLVLYNK